MHKHYMKVFRQAYIPDLFPKGLKLWSTKLSYNGNNQGSFGFRSVEGVQGVPGQGGVGGGFAAYVAGPEP